MVWFPKTKKLKSATPSAARGAQQPASKGEAMWEKCGGGGQGIYVQDWERNWNVGPPCGHPDAPPGGRRGHLRPGLGEELERVPAVRPPRRAPGAAAARHGARPGELRGARRGPVAARPARLRGLEEVQGSTEKHRQD